MPKYSKIFVLLSLYITSILLISKCMTKHSVEAPGPLVVGSDSNSDFCPNVIDPIQLHMQIEGPKFKSGVLHCFDLSHILSQ